MSTVSIDELQSKFHTPIMNFWFGSIHYLIPEPFLLIINENHLLSKNCSLENFSTFRFGSPLFFPYKVIIKIITIRVNNLWGHTSRIIFTSWCVSLNKELIANSIKSWMEFFFTFWSDLHFSWIKIIWFERSE